MYKTNTLQSSHHNFASVSLNGRGADLAEIRDPGVKTMVTGLLRQNQHLHQKLNSEKQRNYQLMELKRRMEEDIKRLEFELERMGQYEHLSSREMEVKRNQVQIDNGKLQAQLDDYFEENKKIRAEVRRLMNQCQIITKQKQLLAIQNNSLEMQLQQLREQITNIHQQHHMQTAQLNQQEAQVHINSCNFIDKIVTVRSAHEQAHSLAFISPPQSPQALSQPSKGFKGQQLSTNPSEGKISLNSPLLSRNKWDATGEPSKIYEQFYESEPEIMPSSFHNELLHRNLDFSSPAKADPSGSHLFPKNSPSVYDYGMSDSPQPPALLPNTLLLKTFQKSSLKSQVASLRDDIVQDLLEKYYGPALATAEQTRSNSLKIFMERVAPQLGTLSSMAGNYLQARALLAESCPTLRLKWEPIDPNANNSSSSQGSPASIRQKNSQSVWAVYESIRQKARREQTEAGQYLALFRYLTLLSKGQPELEAKLIQTIKHSAAKQVHRIKGLPVQNGDSDGE